MRGFSRALAFALALLSLVAAAPVALSAQLTIIAPDHHNRQYLLFWEALGADLFAREHVRVRVVVAERPRQAPTLLLDDANACAILPPPLYYELIARRAPVVLVANLFAGEPANLVVRAGLARTWQLSAGASLGERMAKLRGRRIGVAGGPRPRLEQLLYAADMTGADVHLQTVPGEEQNAALASGEVDAIFAHTPYLERSLVTGDGVLWVDVSRGEVPRLRNLLVHALLCGKPALRERRADIRAVLRALAQARELLRGDAQAATAALAAGLGEPVTPELARLVDLYRPALPSDLSPRTEELTASIPLFPALAERVPDDPAALAAFVENVFGEPVDAAEPAPDPWWLICIKVGAGLSAITAFAVLVLYVVERDRRRRQKQQEVK
jgi:ABC-type nitrate/sulfonate/bicarbonate transport system substrate-binding protein